MSMEKSIDIATLQMLMKLVTPAPVAPVLPVAPIIEYTKGSEGAIGMAKDIEYLRKAVDDIGKQLKDITEKHVTISDFNEHVKISDRVHIDFENRMRVTETTQTRILTWGSIIIGLTTLAQIALKLAGH